MQEDDIFRIVLADDHSLIRHGIKNFITENDQLLVVAEVSNGGRLFIER
jgi:DNA-binding NarL/FixJ family response regulator